MIAHLPLVVRTMMAPAQHLKEDSTAPMAVTSVGSEERGVRRRSSSNSCWWKMAASASLQIWGNGDGERGRVITVHRVRCSRVDIMYTHRRTHTPNASLPLTLQETVPWRSPQITSHSRLRPARRWRRHFPPLWLAVGGKPCSPASKYTHTHTRL